MLQSACGRHAADGVKRAAVLSRGLSTLPAGPPEETVRREIDVRQCYCGLIEKDKYPDSMVPSCVRLLLNSSDLLWAEVWILNKIVDVA